MKTAQVLTIAVLLAGAGAAAAQPAIPAAASYRNVDKARATQQYLACLASLNEGVVVSALAQVAQMQIAHPGESFGTLHRAVGDLAHEGRTREVRSKARLVATVLENPELFAGYADRTFDTADEFLGAVAQRVAESLLTAR
jgi:hypothetical protein